MAVIDWINAMPSLRPAAVYAPHEPNAGHLRKVIADMKRLGPPTVKAWWSPRAKAWIAIEGSHRLAAARALNYPVEIQKVTRTDVVDHDFQDLPDHQIAAGEILDYLIGGRTYDDLVRFANSTSSYGLRVLVHKYQP